jgi:ribosomal-protein-alanine N-acetyltransferase
VSIFLEVRESNLAAQKLYQSCGFEQYSRRKAYYSDPAEDALLYRFLCTPETRENG